jgi:hypothetical protein
VILIFLAYLSSISINCSRIHSALFCTSSGVLEVSSTGRPLHLECHSFSAASSLSLFPSHSLTAQPRVMRLGSSVCCPVSTTYQIASWSERVAWAGSSSLQAVVWGSSSMVVKTMSRTLCRCCPVCLWVSCPSPTYRRSWSSMSPSKKRWLVDVVHWGFHLGLCALKSPARIVIPHLQDTFKNGDSYQVMTQAIGQEPVLTTLHPLPAGSRIMGGQEKGQRHLGWGNPGQPPRLDCFRSTTGVSNAQPYPEEHTAAVDKNLEYL